MENVLHEWTIILSEDDEFYYEILESSWWNISVYIKYFLSKDEDRECLTYWNNLDSDQREELINEIESFFDNFVEVEIAYERDYAWNKLNRAKLINKLKESIQEFFKELKSKVLDSKEFEDWLLLDSFDEEENDLSESHYDDSTSIHSQLSKFNPIDFNIEDKEIFDEYFRYMDYCESYRTDYDIESMINKLWWCKEFRPVRFFDSKNEFIFIQNSYVKDWSHWNSITKSSLKKDFIWSLEILLNSYNNNEKEYYYEEYNTMVLLNRETNEIKFISKKIEHSDWWNNIEIRLKKENSKEISFWELCDWRNSKCEKVYCDDNN